MKPHGPYTPKSEEPDIFGKTASILGTFLVATTTSLTGNASIGVLSIAILLVVALVFLALQQDPTKVSAKAPAAASAKGAAA